MRVLRFLLSILFLAAGAQALQAAVGVETGVFSQGRVRMTVSATSARLGDRDYVVVGGGFGYFLADGLQIGVDGEGWLGNTPSLYKVAPQVLYVFHRFSSIKPYLGAFFRRTFYEDFPDRESFGGRAGIVSSVSGNLYTTFGIVYEEYINYDELRYGRYAHWYPEFGVTVSF